MKSKFLKMAIVCILTSTALSACSEIEDPLVSATDTASMTATTTAGALDAAAATTENAELAAAAEDDMTLVWMSHYDLNPDEGKERSNALAMFEDQFGGKIVYENVSWDNRMDKLAVSVMSGKSPDIVPFDWMTFPADMKKGVFQPVDSIVDYSSDLWKDMADEADMFMYKDKHYVAMYSVNATTLFAYDKTLVEQEGIDDPWELYKNGQWDWDNFRRIMREFCNRGEERWGICDAFEQAIVQSTGETMVTYKDGKFVTNYNNANIDRAMEFVNGLAKDGLINNAWVDPSAAFANGDTLFIGGASWIIDGCIKSVRTTDHEIGIVPTPRDAQADDYYAPMDPGTHLWVAGSTKEKAVKTWFECNRLVSSDPSYEAKNKENTLATTHWTDELYEKNSEINSSSFKRTYEYGQYISDTSKDIVNQFYDCARYNDIDHETWTNLRTSFDTTLQSIIDDFNVA